MELIKVYQMIYGRQDDIDDLDEDEARAELRAIVQELQDPGASA
jgi:hypothetical protein